MEKVKIARGIEYNFIVNFSVLNSTSPDPQIARLIWHHLGDRELTMDHAELERLMSEADSVEGITVVVSGKHYKYDGIVNAGDDEYFSRMIPDADAIYFFDNGNRAVVYVAGHEVVYRRVNQCWICIDYDRLEGAA